jgi:hypothetical protein
MYPGFQSLRDVTFRAFFNIQFLPHGKILKKGPGNVSIYYLLSKVLESRVKNATVHNLVLLTLFGNIHAHIRHTNSNKSV